jgi:predicted short-subunit dehydrogenase-like oxidoreductase (DUF2520 family)
MRFVSDMGAAYVFDSRVSIDNNAIPDGMPVDPIIIVGPGRLGRSAAILLENRGYTVHLVGRGHPIPAGPLTWLTVPDQRIADAARCVPEGGIVLHASGATDLGPLRPHAPAGSLHPLMTFPGPEVALPSGVIPAAVAGDPAAIDAARTLAVQLGFSPFIVSGDRALYHAAAVTAGNFATTLLHEASTLLAAAGVPMEDAPRLLAPLALRSLENTAAHGAASTLTGPVARGDEAVIQRHLSALADFPPHTRAVYAALLDATRRLAESGGAEE